MHHGPRTLKLWEWRTQEVAYPMCLPTTLRILNPANLFCNMQCTTVCITAAGLRVAKRTPGSTPGMCPGGVPQRVCATRLSVDHRGVFPGDLRVAESPQQPVGQTPESGEPVSLTGRSRGWWKTGVAAGAHGPPGGASICAGAHDRDFAMKDYWG